MSSIKSRISVAAVTLCGGSFAAGQRLVHWLGDSMSELRQRSSWGRFVMSADWLLIAIPGLIWGASFLFIAEGLKAIGANGITFMRLFIGLATLALFPAARKPVERSAWPGIALVGVLWFAFPLSMFPFAEQRVSSALTGMLNTVVPLFTAVVATAIAGKVPERRVIVGLAIGLMGAGLVAWPTLQEGHSSVVGVLLVLAAVVSYGFALNLARPLQQQYGALPVILRAQTVAVMLTAPLGVPDVLAARWTPAPFFSLLMLGAFGTGVAFVALVTAAGRVGATRASSAAFLIPPVALLLGVLVRGEYVAMLSIFGSVVCVAGAWLMHRPQIGRERDVKPLQSSTLVAQKGES
jgi:drug/metabolite transporter (DMT)-like permease